MENLAACLQTELNAAQDITGTFRLPATPLVHVLARRLDRGFVRPGLGLGLGAGAGADYIYFITPRLARASSSRGKKKSSKKSKFNPSILFSGNSHDWAETGS